MKPNVNPACVHRKHVPLHSDNNEINYSYRSATMGSMGTPTMDPRVDIKHVPCPTLPLKFLGSSCHACRYSHFLRAPQGKTDVSFNVSPAYLTFMVRAIFGTEAWTFRERVTHNPTKFDD